MKKRFPQIKLFLVALALGLIVSNLSHAAKPTNQELKIGINSEYETLHPGLVSTVAGKYIITMAYRLPVFLSPDLKWSTHLIKALPSLEKKTAKFVTKNGIKGIAAQFEVLDNAKWGDGTPITCADFKLDWEIKTNNNVSYGNREPYMNIKDLSWDAKTPKKCSIVFEKAVWDYAQNIPFAIPSHLEREIYEKHKSQPEAYERNSLYSKTPTNPGLWNGPYLIKEVALGSHVVLVPNPFFYGKKPAIQKIIFKILPNTGTLEANLRSGNIDMISYVGLSFDQALAFDQKTKTEKLPYIVQFQNGTSYVHIDLNLRNPILAEVKVRQAISHAINKPRIIKSLYEGKAIEAVHWMTPSDPWSTNSADVVKRYPYDRKKAKDLLDQAGWKVGADGIRTKDGKKLTLNLAAGAGIKLNENLQAVIQSQLKEVGIDLTLKTEPARLFFSETLPKGKFDMAMFTWSSMPEMNPESNFSIKNIPTEKNTWTGQNYTGWNNPKVSENIDKINAEFDSAKRKKLVAEIIKAYTEEVPVIPMVFRMDNAVLPANMKGYKMTGHMFYDTNQVEKWSLE